MELIAQAADAGGDASWTSIPPLVAIATVLITRQFFPSLAPVAAELEGAAVDREPA